MSLLEVKELEVHLDTSIWGLIIPVRNVSFAIQKGEALGLVGESGCGKTMTSLAIMRLLPQQIGKIANGQILFNGENLVKKTDKEMTNYRGEKISMIPQDPMTSLNPLFSIGNQIGEVFAIHEGLRGKKLRQKVIDALKLVGIMSGKRRLTSYPHEFSGGMRQRVVGAIAIGPKPDLLIADEPTTSLDSTIQFQYLNMLKDLQTKYNIALLFISHNLGIVARMCDKVATMYAGQIIEFGKVHDIFYHPAHPYTRGLLASLPSVNKKVQRLAGIDGVAPNPTEIPTGCPFLPRCNKKISRCEVPKSPPQVIVGPQHTVSCWLFA